MNYKLPDLDLSKYNKVFVGKRERWATATATCFISDKHILIASFLGKKIYLIDLENLEIINEVDTVNHPDLMDYKDGVITITERHHTNRIGNIGLFELENNTITHKKNIDFSKFTELHGIRILDRNHLMFTDKNKNKGVHILDITTNKVNSPKNFKLPPCDIFLINDKILVLTTETKPNHNGLKHYDTKLSHLHLFEFPSFNELSKISFDGQVDCIAYENGKGFITIQSNDSLYHFELNNNTLIGLGEIKKDFSFPHGVAMFNGKVCVTNYGTNSIDILKYKELV